MKKLINVFAIVTMVAALSACGQHWRSHKEHFTVYFDSGSDAVKAEYHKLLEKIAARLSGDTVHGSPVPWRNQNCFSKPGCGGRGVVTERVKLKGHTDTVGTDERNLKLSQNRADAVRKLLIEHGANESSIVTRGKGERALAVQTTDNVAEPENRRVEIYVH